MSLFGMKTDEKKFTFAPIFGLDVSSLALYSQAQMSKRSAALDPISNLPDSLFGKAFDAPWELPASTQSLATRINEARNLQKFVNNNAADVRVAGTDNDSRSLFALYKGLAALQTLAQYASEKSTVTSSLASLDTQFQKGLKEVQDYFTTMQTTKLHMLLGDKTTSTTTTTSLGKNSSSHTGAVIQKGQRSDPLAGITGTETFAINMTKNGVTDTFNVDLSTIVGPVSINAVVDAMNQQISSLLLTDTFGNPVLDGQGNTQSKYLSRFSVSMDKNFDYSIKLDGLSTETVAMVPGTSEPTLYVTGNLQSYDATKPATGTLTKINNLLGGGTTSSANLIQGTDPLASEMAAATAAAAAASTVDKVAAFEALTGVTVKPKAVAGTTTPVVDNTVHAATTTSSVAVDAEGSSYVVGTSMGTMGNQINSDNTSDVYLNKMDSLGNVIYSRYIGNSTTGGKYDVTVDGSGNVIVAGQTGGKLSTTDVITSTDAFVTKFNSNGDELFTYQLDTASVTNIADVKVDAAGDIYVAGYASGFINATSSFAGGTDAMVLKISGSTGTLADSTLFGTAGIDKIGGISFAADGNLLVASDQNGTATLTKLDAAALGTQIYSTALGALNGGQIGGITVDGGNIYVAGTTTNATFSQAEGATLTNAHSGGSEGFVMSLSDTAAPVLTNTTFIGSAGTDVITDITANGGTVYVSGQTNGSINGTAKAGNTDAFVASVNGTSGAIGFVQQFGQFLGSAGATGIAFAGTGTSVLEKLGLRQGTLQTTQKQDINTQTSVRDGDYFYIAVNGAAKRKISLKAGDTFASIATRINTLSFRNIKATVVTGTEGDTLRIQAVNGGEISLSVGDGDKDALRKIGLKPTTLLSQELLFPVDPDPKHLNGDDIGGTFALDLTSAYHIRDKNAAQYTLGKIDAAISSIQRAYKSLTIDAADIVAFRAKQAKIGAPSPYMSSRIANFQDALSRLQYSSYSPASGKVV